MKLAVSGTAVAGGALAALLALSGALAAPSAVAVPAAQAAVSQAGAGGAGSVAASSGPRQGTVPGCSAYVARAIERHVTVVRIPAPCQGLSAAEINQAAAQAIVRVAGGVPKAIFRKRAAQAARYLDHLVTAPPAIAGSRPAAPGSGTPAGRPLGGQDLSMDIAALIAWLVTAASGGYVLLRWIARGGTLRRRAGSTGSPPVVIVGHFGLALAGLAVWVAYMIAGWSALAWVCVGVLLPIAGLGMAALAIGLPGAPSPTAAQAAVTGSAAGPAPAGGPVAIGTAVAGRVQAGPASAKRRLSPLIIVAHGALAVTTIALVLLAALGPAGS